VPGLVHAGEPAPAAAQAEAAAAALAVQRRELAAQQEQMAPSHGGKPWADKSRGGGESAGESAGGLGGLAVAAPAACGGGTSAPLASALPPGWEAKASPDGRPYYLDHNTQVRHTHNAHEPVWNGALFCVCMHNMFVGPSGLIRHLTNVDDALDPAAAATAATAAAAAAIRAAAAATAICSSAAAIHTRSRTCDRVPEVPRAWRLRHVEQAQPARHDALQARLPSLCRPIHRQRANAQVRPVWWARRVGYLGQALRAGLDALEERVPALRRRRLRGVGSSIEVFCPL
jgi:hypothetical protein